MSYILRAQRVCHMPALGPLIYYIATWTFWVNKRAAGVPYSVLSWEGLLKNFTA